MRGFGEAVEFVISAGGDVAAIGDPGADFDEVAEEGLAFVFDVVGACDPE